MADVFDAADFFIQIANQSEDDQMTNLKLNKLLYYTQGAFLARTLFSPIGTTLTSPVLNLVSQKSFSML